MNFENTENLNQNYYEHQYLGNLRELGLGDS